MPSLVLIQWGVVGFFVAIHFIFGFLRGTLRSGYYTIANILVMLFILWVVSAFSISTFFTAESLIELIQSNTGNAIPSDIVTYLSDPSVFAFAVAIADAIIKLVLFYILFIFFRWFLSFVFFGAIWKLTIGRYLKQSAKKTLVDANEQTTKVVKVKRKKTFASRIGGALIGSVRGLVTAFVLLMPLLIILSSLSNLTFEETTVSSEALSEINANEQPLESIISSDIEEMVEWLNELNDENVTIIFGNLGTTLFDWAFETSFESGQSFNIKDELSVVVQIVDVLNDNGFLDSSNSIDIERLDEDNIDALNEVIDLIQSSSLVIGALDTGSSVLADGLIEELLGVDFSGNVNAQNALNELKNLNWSDEFDNIQAIVEALLAFGSINELMDLANDPNQVFELSSEEVTALADVVRRLGDLQLMKLLNIGLEYAITLDEVTSFVEWVPENEREDYLRDVLATILSDTEFFYGEDGDIYNIANLVEIVLTQYGDFAITQLLSEDFAVDSLFSEDVEAFINATLEGVSELETFVQFLPIAVDFGIYTLTESTEESVAEALSETIENLDVTAEFETFADIYASLVTIGVEQFLSEDADVIALVDGIVKDNLEDVKILVDQIFEQSILVNSTLEVATPIIIDAFISDEALSDILKTVLLSDDELAFSIGAEIVKLLDITKSIHDVASFETLLDATTDSDELMMLLDMMLSEELDTLEQAFLDVLELAPLDRALNLAFEDIINYVLGDNDFANMILEVYTTHPDMQTADLKDELGALVSAVFDVVDSLNTIDFYDHNNLATILSDTNDVDVAAILSAYDTDEKVDNAFAALNGSLLLRAFVPEMMSLVGEVIEGYELMMPELAMDGQLLKDDALTDIFKPLMRILGNVVNESGMVTLGDLTGLTESMDALMIYDMVYAIDSNDLDLIAGADLILGLVSDLLFSQDVRDYVYTLANDAVGISLTTALELSRENDVLTAEELGDVFTIVHDLNIPRSIFIVPDGRIVSTSDALFSYLQSFDDEKLGIIFDNTLINDVLTSVLDDEGILDYADTLYDEVFAPSINSLLDGFGITGTLDIDVRAFAEGFVGIKNTEGQFDLRQLVPIFEAYQSLDIQTYTEFTALTDIEFVFNRLDAKVTDENIIHALSSRFITYPFGFILSDEVSGHVAATLVNGLASDFNVTFPESAFTFSAELFETNGDLKPEYLAEIFAAAYAVLNIDGGLTIEAISGLEEPVRIYGRTQSIVEHVLDVEILYQVIDTLTIKPEVIEPLTIVFNQTIQNYFDANPSIVDQVESFGIDPAGVALESLALTPDALDENGRFNRDELLVLISIASTMIEAVEGDFSQLTSIETLYGVFKNSDVIDILFESALIHLAVSFALGNESLITAGARAFESTVESTLGVSVSVDDTLLDITLDKYDIFYENENGSLRIEKDAIKDLLYALLALEYEDYTIGNLAGIYTLLQQEDLEGNTYLENIVSSKIIIAVLDKVLNLETDPSGLKPAFATIANDFLSTLLAGETLSSDVFNMYGITDASGVLAPEAVLALIDGLYVLGLFDADGLSNLGLGSVTTLWGSNIDPVTREDDLDRLLNANILVSLLDNFLLLDNLNDIIINLAGDTTGFDLSFVDFSIPNSAIETTTYQGEALDRVSRDAWRDLIHAIDALQIEEQLAGGTLGFNVLTDMIDFNEPSSDRFSQFLASDILYVWIARIIDSESLSSQITDVLPEELSGFLGDFTLVSPLDARGDSGVEDGLFSRREFRKFIEAIVYLGIDFGAVDPNFLSYIFNMIDANINPTTGVDDFDRFFSSIYIQDKLSGILLSDDITGLIAGELFDAADFIPGLPDVATITVGDTVRLREAEFRKMFIALETLDLTDLSNVSLDVESLGDLTSEDLDNVLASDYVYTIIDLILKAQDTIVIPAEAIEDVGDYVEMVKKSEISTILNLLGSGFDPNSATIADLENLYFEDSAIVDSLITTAIEELLGTLPQDAYDGDLILRSEMRAIIDTLLILADDDDTVLLSSFDFNNLSITIQDLEDMLALESTIIKSLITDIVSDVLTLSNDAFIDDDPNNPIKDPELDRFVAMLLILTDNDYETSLTTFDFNDLTITVGMLDELVNLNSVIVQDIISDVITTAITVSEDVYEVDSTTRIQGIELRGFVDMIIVLADDDLTLDISTLDFATLTVTVQMLNSLVLIDSLIVQDILSDVVTTALTVSDDVFEVGSTTRILQAELISFAGMVEILFDGDLTADVTSLDVSTLSITTDQLSSMLALNSFIVEDVLSDVITTAITVSADSFVDGSTRRVQYGELDAFIEMMTILVDNDPTADITALDFANLSITTDQLYGMQGLGSPLVDDVLSDVVTAAITVSEDAFEVDSTRRIQSGELLSFIDMIYVLVDYDDTEDISAIDFEDLSITVGMLGDLTTIPGVIVQDILSDVITTSLTVSEDVFEDGSTTRVLDFEIDNFVEMITILANYDLDADITALDFADLSVSTAQLDAMYSLGSPLVDDVLSDVVTAAIDVADDIYVDGSDRRLKPQELFAFIEMIEILVNYDEEADISALDFASLSITAGMLDDLRNTSGLIVQDILSDVITTALSVSSDAFSLFSTTRILLSEIDDFVEMILILVDYDDTVDIGTLDFANLSVDFNQLESLSLLPGVIVRDVLSDVITTALDAPDESFDAPSTTRLLETEIYAFVDMIGILLGDPTQDISTLDFANLTITTDQISALNQIVSPLIESVVSDAVISAVDVPLRAYVDGSTTFVKKDEIDSLVLALQDIGITDFSQDISFDAITVGSIDDFLRYNSFILDRMLSTTLSASLTIPSGAYDTAGDVTKDLLRDEIENLYFSLFHIAGSDTATIDTVLTGLDPQAISPYTLDAMLGDGGLIVYRLIAEGIIGTGNVVAGQFAELGDENFDPNAVNSDVKISEMQHIVDSLIILDIASLADISSIDINSFALLSEQDIDDVVDVGGPNTYMYYLINDIVATPEAITSYNFINPQNTITADSEGRVTKEDLVRLIDFGLNQPLDPL